MTTRAPKNDLADVVFIDFQDIKLGIKTKFKIFKFMKLINTDPIAAMSLALTEESLEVVDDLEMGFKEFEELVNKISDALSGADLKN